MNNNYEVLDILMAYSNLGKQELEDKTILIGRAPHIAPKAWLHSIHAPLSDQEINELEKDLGTIPEDYKSFLKTANGIKIFNTTFCLYGLRKTYKRGVNDVWQPFDILTPNILERSSNATKNMFFIGGYDWDGSLLYFDLETNKIHLCDNDDATSIYEWDNFIIMLNTEVKRLSTLFDINGKEYDENRSTLPY